MLLLTLLPQTEDFLRSQVGARQGDTSSSSFVLFNIPYGSFCDLSKSACVFVTVQGDDLKVISIRLWGAKYGIFLSYNNFLTPLLELS